MTTIVNTPPATDSSGNGFVIGAVVIVGLVILFIFAGLPAIRQMKPAQVNVPTQVVVPDKVDVTVDQAK